MVHPLDSAQRAKLMEKHSVLGERLNPSNPVPTSSFIMSGKDLA